MNILLLNTKAQSPFTKLHLLSTLHRSGLSEDTVVVIIVSLPISFSEITDLYTSQKTYSVTEGKSLNLNNISEDRFEISVEQSSGLEII